MAKIKLTKNELKKQKDSLKRFERYLPTLQLKKQQLQMEIRKIDEALRAKVKELTDQKKGVDDWVAVMGEDVKLQELVSLKEVVIEDSNIAGVEIPVFKSVSFNTKEYDLFSTPLWVDAAVEAIKALLSLMKEEEILRQQYDLLKEELTVTTQRVNLFEKVMIPDTRGNIKVIQIYLGDQQTAAVVRGKISKKALVEKANK